MLALNYWFAFVAFCQPIAPPTVAFVAEGAVFTSTYKEGTVATELVMFPNGWSYGDAPAIDPTSPLGVCMEAAKTTCVHGVKSVKVTVNATTGETTCSYECFPAPSPQSALN